MYSIEQAQEVLRKKQYDDIMKRMKYHEHMENVKRVKETKVPFKIIQALYDDKEFKELLPNRFYPKSHNNIQSFNKWIETAHPELVYIFGTEQERKDGTGTQEQFSQRFEFMFDVKGKDKISLGRECWTPQYKALYEEYENSQQAFDNVSSEGIAKSKYYMARFLQGYDFTTFSMFDFYGMMNHTQQEVEQFRRECMELQADFEKNPQNYFTEYVPRYHPTGTE